MCKDLVTIINSPNKQTPRAPTYEYTHKAFPCGRTREWEVYLVRAENYGQKVFADTASSLPEQKEVIIILVWYQAVGWTWTFLLKTFILSDILYLNSSKEEENLIFELISEAYPYSYSHDTMGISLILDQLNVGSQLSFCITSEACKNLLEEGCGDQPFSELWVVMTPISSLPISWIWTPGVGLG